MPRYLAFLAVALVIAACGGGGGGMSETSRIPVTPDPMPEPQPESMVPATPPDGVRDALAAPVVDLDTARYVERRTLSGIRHVGADTAPLPAGTTCDRSGVDRFGQPATVPSARWCESPLPDHTLPGVAQHGTVAVSYGRIKDGVGRDRVIAFLKENAVASQEWVPGLLPGLTIRSEPLTVRMFEGTTEKQAGYVIDAIRIINAALPREWKLTLSDERTPEVAVADIPAGEVHVGFNLVPDSGRFNLTIRDGAFTGGRLLIRSDLPPYGAQSAVATATEHDYHQTNVGLLVHEIMHAMGFLAHPDMVSATSYDRDLTGWAGLPAHVLYPLDREALLAAFTRLGPGDHRPEDIAQGLGPWSDTSIHVRGVLGLRGGGGDMAFGAAHRNGFAQPWAYGPAPRTDLSDSARIAGSASWEGRLLGLTPQAETVAGTAGLAVRLDSLTGSIEFTGLEQWSGAPGAIGSGTMWGDGDLGYAISVQGNVFVQTGGDEGQVTGAFFGAAHEGMGGTLERDDLAAGFAGTR